MSNEVRTRIGPSPTGSPHLGTIYQVLFDKAFALKHNGKFILRIEDTDRNRFVEDAEEKIYEALDWVKLIPDESPIHGGNSGPYRQSERLKLYGKYTKQLISVGKAYHCFCSPERLQEVRKKLQKERKPSMYDKHCRNLSSQEIKSRLSAGEKCVIRMKIPVNKKIVCEDLIRGKIEFDSNLVDDQVIIKSDGFPTYHLAVVVDDHLMKISHVVRGPEWITSFPKHKLLYDYFGWEMPIFIHTPIITNMDGSKLGKRHGHASIDWYRKNGYFSEAVLNYISLLGWSHPEEKEIFDFDEFVKVFDLKDLSAVNPKFDLKKMEWMNGQYMRKLSNKDFINRLIEWLKWTKNEGVLKFVEGLSTDEKQVFAEMNKVRVKVFEDVIELNKFFWKDLELDIKLLTKYRSGEGLKNHLAWVLKLLDDAKWTLSDLKKVESMVKNKAEKLNWKIFEVFYPIRAAVCRSTISPPLFESIYILGKEKTVDRLYEAISLLKD